MLWHCREDLWHLLQDTDIILEEGPRLPQKFDIMEELAEVITSAQFHPTQCNIFAYSSSKGTVRLCDMRAKALCDASSKSFEMPVDPAAKSFFSEIISSISDVKFDPTGGYFFSRDFLTCQIFSSLRMNWRKDGAPGSWTSLSRMPGTFRNSPIRLAVKLHLT